MSHSDKSGFETPRETTGKRQASFDFAQSILDTMRESMLILDGNLRVRMANRSFCRRFEVTLAETKGQLLYALGNGQWNIPRLRVLLEEIIPQNSVFDDFEIEHDFPNIGRRKILLNARKVWWEANHSESVLLAIEDITEHHRAEEERRRVSELNARLLNSSPDCIKVLDTEANLLSMSENGMRTLCIRNLDPFLGTCWLDFWKDEDYEEARRAVTAAKNSDNGAFDGFLPTLDGEPRWWHVAVSPVMGSDGKPEFLLAISRDITDRKTAEQRLTEMNQKLERAAAELTRSNEDLERFARVAAHDLKSPVNTIVMFAQLLRHLKGDLQGEEAQMQLAFIEDSGRKLGALIKDLLDYSLLAQFPPLPEISQAQDACQSACAHLRWAIRESAAEVRCEMDDEVHVALPFSLFTQLLQNLIANAVHYRRAGVPARISVSVAKQAQQWLFSIADNGMGIEQQYAEAIFEPFRRLQENEASGTGLGLAICKRIVERAGGRIWVNSRKGEGSTFYFLLPSAVAGTYPKPPRTEHD